MKMDEEHQRPLLAPFSNEQEEDAQILRKQIYVQTNDAFKYEENPNPNVASRLVGKIYQSYKEMLKGVYNMLFYLNDYKRTLSNHNKRMAIEHKLKQAPQSVAEQQRKLHQELCSQDLPLLLFKISLVHSDEQRLAIKNCINKLKVMIVKAQYRQSTSLEYLIECYTSNLKDCLNKHQIRYLQQKSEKYRLLRLIFERNEFIQAAFETIKNKFAIISLKELKLCKIAPHFYISQLRKGHTQEKPLFFINFYTESLLFIQNEYTKFDPNLLYCPVVTIYNTVLLSEYYLIRLNEASLQWASEVICIEIYHKQTSTQSPLFFNKMQKTRLQVPQIQYILKNEVQRNFRLKKESINLNILINKINIIKRFIYVKLVFNWLKQIFGGQPHQPIQIQIYKRFTVHIKIASQDDTYSASERPPEERTQFLANLFMLATNKKNANYSKQCMKQKVVMNLQSSLLKILGEKTGARVSWPLQNGSMGHYYYDYSKEKTINRCQVSQLLNKF